MVENWEYNYVLLGQSWDLYKQSFADIYGRPNTVYLSFDIFEKLQRNNFLFRLHTGGINKYINLPLKDFWHDRLINTKTIEFRDNKPICFIFTWPWAFNPRYTGIPEYCKSKWPDCKCILFMTDLLRLQKVRPKFLKTKFDFVLSFDHEECKEFDFKYHPLVFSKYSKVDDKYQDTDIYFLGQAKNRLEVIYSVFEKLDQLGLKTDFNIIGVPDDKRKYETKINFIDGMSYDENLQHVVHTKCVLEIMQKGGHGFTQRTVEVLGLNKRLLTNNTEIVKSSFFNKKYMSKFEDADSIDPQFIANLSEHIDINYNCAEKLSPVELLYFIDNLFK